MSLKHAILVMLENEPGTGYDLAQRFKSGIGHFWNAKHQQIYLELKKLHHDKWVAFAVEAQTDKPDKKIYRITRAGQKALKDWLRKPIKPPRINDALLVKVFGAQPTDIPVLLAEFDEHITRYRARLAEYSQMEQAFFEQDAATRQRYRLPYLTLRRGIRYVRGTLEWLEEARELLASNGLPAAPLLGTHSRKPTQRR